MKYNNERKGAFVTVIVTLSLLLCSLAFPASAAMRARQADSMHPRLRQTLSIDAENGRVSDGDGIIGNSLRGADAAHPRRAHRKINTLPKRAENAVRGAADAVGDAAKGAADAVGDMARSVTDSVGDMTRGEAGSAGDNIARDDVGDPAAPDAQGHALTRPDADTNEMQENTGRGVLGWVLAVLVILAIALVVLALLPKKQRDRS